MKKNISCLVTCVFFLNSHINMERKFIENDNTTRERHMRDIVYLRLRKRHPKDENRNMLESGEFEKDIHRRTH